MDVSGLEEVREQNLPEGRPFLLRIWGSFAAMMFGLAILLLSLLAVSNPSVVFPSEMVASEAGKINEAKDVKYYLPYPGILPDSSLYKVKMLRDKLSLMVTFDPLKKARKELLFADKRINAAVALVDGGKLSLGVTTATKAEKYLEQSARELINVQRQDKDVKSWLLNLKTAAAKHAQILVMMRDKLDGTDRMTIERTLKNTQLVQENVEQALLDSK